MENIPIQEHQGKKPIWRKIPGFRSGKPWKMVLASVVYGFVILFIIAVNSGPSTSNQQAKNKVQSEQSQESTAPQQPQTQAQQVSTTQSTTQPQNTQEKKVPGSLGFKPEEFKSRFNKAAAEFKSDLRISNLKVETGAVQDVFQYMLTDRLGITGTVNKADGTVRDVMIIGQGDGTIKSGLNIITSMGILISAVNPELSASERGNILRDLGILGDNVDVTKLNGKTIRNGKKYWVNSSKEIGVMFGVGDASDKG